MNKEQQERLSQLVEYNRPIGTGRGYRLSDEMKQEIYELYFNGPYGLRGIAHKLGIHMSTVRTHVNKFKEMEQ